MDLLILFLVFAALGYLLGVTRFGGKAGQTTEKVALGSKRWMDRLEDNWKTTFVRRNFARDFQAYVSEKAPELFPAGFREWLGGLSERELLDFTNALVNYSHSLGYSLNELVDGGLDQDPRMRQVFVEAIVVYSPAYRKARQARQESDAAEEAEAAPGESGNGKLPAEKAPSRRSTRNVKETVEPASTD